MHLKRKTRCAHKALTFFRKKSGLLCLTLSLALAFCALPSAVFAETGESGGEEIVPAVVSDGSTTAAAAKTRGAGESGPLYTVADGDTLTVNVKIDGNREEMPSSSGPLVEVESGGTLILNSGAELCNNAETAIVSHGGTVIVNTGAKIYNCGSLSKKTTAAATKTEYRLSEECDLYTDVAEPPRAAQAGTVNVKGMNSKDYLNSVLADWADALDTALKAYEAGDYDGFTPAANRTGDAYEILRSFANSNINRGKYGSWSYLYSLGCWDCQDLWNDSTTFKLELGIKNGINFAYAASLYAIPNSLDHIVTINAGDPIESLDAEETYGGAIYADGGSKVTINGGKIGGDSEIEDGDYNELDRFENGNVAAFGGAIYMKGEDSNRSTLTISGGEFTYNDTYHGKDNAWSDTTVSSLSETGFGGAIYAGEYTDVTVTGGSFTHNRAHSGGVLYVAENATATIGQADGGENPLLDSNTCTFGNGGAIAVAGGTLTMESGKLHNNQANWPEIGTNNTQANGGGVALIADGSTFNLKGGLITGNISVDNGGGIAMLNGTDNVFNMTGGTLKDNVSPNAPKTRDFIDPTARGSELYVGSGNKRITLSGGEIVNSDITAANSDNSAIYLNNTLSNDDTNFIKLDGVRLEGVIYLTQLNTLPITATERCPEDIKLNFHLSDGYTANSVVVDVKTGGDTNADKALAEKLLGNATIVNPNNRILGKNDNGDIYIVSPKAFTGAIYENNEKTTLYGNSGQVWNYSGSSLALPDPHLNVTSPTLAGDAIITYSYGFVGTDAGNLALKESGQYSTTKPADAGYYYVRARIEEPAADPSGVPSVGYVYTGPFCIQSKPITVTIDNRSSTTSSSSLAALTWNIPNGSLAAGDTKDDLKITLTTDAVPGQVGTYKITGTWDNKNYAVTFLPAGGATYTIKKAPSYSGGSSHTTSYDVIERNDFLEKHETILKADANKITLNDEAKVLAALKDYDALSKDAQYLLDEEHAKLLTLKARVDALRAEETAKAEQNKPDPSKNPKTGDSTGLALPVILLLTGIGLFSVSALARKRRDNR